MTGRKGSLACYRIRWFRRVACTGAVDMAIPFARGKDLARRSRQVP